MRLPLPPCLLPTLPNILRLPLRAQPFVPRRILTTSTASRAPIDIPKLIVPPGSPSHDSLPSFLEYAERQKVDKRSTVYVGTHYEYVVSQSLLRLGFSLFRVGGRSDRGIDLLGHWVLPTLREPLRVVVQCKGQESGSTPGHIRELEGSFEGTPASWRNKDVLGLLVTSQNATRGVLERIGLSRLPLGFVKVSRRGTIEQFLWNEAAQERGLEGVGVTVRYTPLVLRNDKDAMLDEDEEGIPKTVSQKSKRRTRVREVCRIGGAKKDIQLTWMGSPIFPERESLDEETIQLMDVLSHNSREFSARRNKKTPAVYSGATPKPRSTAANPSGRPVGRPPGSRTKKKTPAAKTSKKSSDVSTVVQKPARGRPKGSKNKAKPDAAVNANG